MGSNPRPEGRRGHVVTFYELDRDLVEVVARHLGEGLLRGERALAVVSDAHAAQLDAALRARDVDPVAARADGRYVCLDATRTLHSCQVDGVFAPDRFIEQIGGLLTSLTADGHPVRAFGEVVAELWTSGNVTAALELEATWDAMPRPRDCSFQCAYPASMLGAAGVHEVSRVCDSHSLVLPPAGYDSSRRLTARSQDHRAETFLPVPESVGAARGFVTEVLEGWHEEQALHDATLLVSELATNAVQHGASAFRASLDRTGDGIRVSVEDAGRGEPEPRHVADDALDGRGMTIVGALARRWGCDVLPVGKVVWADLHAPLVADPAL